MMHSPTSTRAMDGDVELIFLPVIATCNKTPKAALDGIPAEQGKLAIYFARLVGLSYWTALSTISAPVETLLQCISSIS